MLYNFIVNGRDDKASKTVELLHLLDSYKENIEFEIHKTTAPGEATDFVKKVCAKKPDDEICFVACGGDGTIKEVATALVGTTNKCMAIYAMGTGNDFVKYYKDKCFTSIDGIINGIPGKIDIMKINDEYSINVCNFGFDSVVGSTGAKLAEKGWKNPYRWGIVAAILKGRFNHIKVAADGEVLNRKSMLLCTLANNHYVGGEFFCAPKAKNNDGLIDVCLIKTMSLVSFLKILPVYTAGQHLDNPKFAKHIQYRQAKQVEISATKPIWLCLDGEMILNDHFTATIIPDAITLVTSK